MPQNDKNQNLTNPPALDPDTVKSLIDNQRLELNVQKLEKEIRLKELESNTKLAEKSIDIQERILSSPGKDFRMMVTRIALIGFLFLIVLLIF